MQFLGLCHTLIMRVSLFFQISFSLKNNWVRNIGLNEWTLKLIGSRCPLQLWLGARVVQYRESVGPQTLVCLGTTWMARCIRPLGSSNHFLIQQVWGGT